MCDVDRFVDRLYSPIVKELKIDAVVTEWHRYVVDLNRLPDDVDPETVVGSSNKPGSFWNGLHWLRTTRGDKLMPGPISMEAHNQLVAKYFEPFHAQVRAAYSAFRSAGAGEIYHIDAHSMPSVGTKSHRDPGQTRADIVVSDFEGKSCSRFFKELVIAGYEKAGLKVAYNWPYFGGRVTQTYGRPEEGQQAIQVEIKRSLYMDEEKKTWLEGQASALQKKLSVAIRHIYDGLPDLK